MFRFVMIFCILACASVFADEASHYKEFDVKASPKTVSMWLRDHQKEVATATGSEFVSQNGNILRLKQDTPKGLIEFSVQETHTQSGTGFEYKSKLIKVYSGILEDQSTEVTLKPAKGGMTRVTIELKASVRDTRGAMIKPRLHKSIRGFQELLNRKFR